MSESAIRARIKAVVDAVGSEGTVHDYERWAPDWDAFKTLFTSTISGAAYIRGWTITCQSAPQERDDFDSAKLRTYTYIIRGYWGLDDAAASEKDAIAKALGVVVALDADTTLHGGGYYDAPPASLTTFEPRVFGDALCHYIEIQQKVVEQL